MSLQARFDDLLSLPDPLARLDDLVWQSLDAGSRSPEHAWNLAAWSTTVVSPGQPARPSCRTVVLRKANSSSRALECHTDARSEKVRELQSPVSTARSAWLFYDSSAKIQLRLEGITEVINGTEADQAWSSTPLVSRAAYLSVATPGTESGGRLPPDTSDRWLSQEESERGRDNFRIVRTTVEHADLLYLKATGHVRARWNSSSSTQGWVWIVP